MAETKQAKSSFRFSGHEPKPGDMTIARNRASREWSHVFTEGTGASQIDLMAHDDLTLTGAPVTVDLQNFTDVFNTASQSMQRLKAIVIVNTGDTGIVTVVAGATTLPWQETAAGIEIFHPGDSLVLQIAAVANAWSIGAGNSQIVFDIQGIVTGYIDYFFAGESV